MPWGTPPPFPAMRRAVRYGLPRSTLRRASGHAPHLRFGHARMSTFTARNNSWSNMCSPGHARAASCARRSPAALPAPARAAEPRLTLQLPNAWPSGRGVEVHHLVLAARVQQAQRLVPLHIVVGATLDAVGPGRRDGPRQHCRARAGWGCGGGSGLAEVIGGRAVEEERAGQRAASQSASV